MRVMTAVFDMFSSKTPNESEKRFCMRVTGKTVWVQLHIQKQNASPLAGGGGGGALIIITLPYSDRLVEVLTI